MFKIQKFKTVWNLEFGILDLFRISNFGFRIFIPRVILQTSNYEKTSQKYQKVYQKRESSDSPGGFRCERTGKINSRDASEIF